MKMIYDAIISITLRAIAKAAESYWKSKHKKASKLQAKADALRTKARDKLASIISKRPPL